MPELGLAFETSMEMCGGTQQAADMRMHPLIVATRARWAARAEKYGTVVGAHRHSHMGVTLSQSHEQQAHDHGRELEYLHRNKWTR